MNQFKTTNMQTLLDGRELSSEQSNVLSDMILNEAVFAQRHADLLEAIRDLERTDEVLFFDIEDSDEDLHTESLHVLKDYLRRSQDPMLQGFLLGLISFRTQLLHVSDRDFGCH